MVLVTRPRRGQSVAVRSSSSMGWVGESTAASVGLSAEVCQVCGYGPTELQQVPLEGGRTVMHSATPVLYLIPD